MGYFDLTVYERNLYDKKLEKLNANHRETESMAYADFKDFNLKEMLQGSFMKDTKISETWFRTQLEFLSVQFVKSLENSENKDKILTEFLLALKNIYPLSSPHVVKICLEELSDSCFLDAVIELDGWITLTGNFTARNRIFNFTSDCSEADLENGVFEKLLKLSRSYNEKYGLLLNKSVSREKKRKLIDSEKDKSIIIINIFPFILTFKTIDEIIEICNESYTDDNDKIKNTMDIILSSFYNARHFSVPHDKKLFIKKYKSIFLKNINSDKFSYVLDFAKEDALLFFLSTSKNKENPYKTLLDFIQAQYKSESEKLRREKTVYLFTTYYKRMISKKQTKNKENIFYNFILKNFDPECCFKTLMKLHPDDLTIYHRSLLRFPLITNISNDIRNSNNLNDDIFEANVYDTPFYFIEKYASIENIIRYKLFNANDYKKLFVENIKTEKMTDVRAILLKDRIEFLIHLLDKLKVGQSNKNIKQFLYRKFIEPLNDEIFIENAIWIIENTAVHDSTVKKTLISFLDSISCILTDEDIKTKKFNILMDGIETIKMASEILD